MRRDGEEASLHRGRGEERRSADRRQSHGTATGTQSTYDHRSRGKILYRVIFFFFFPNISRRIEEISSGNFCPFQKFELTLKRVRNYIYFILLCLIFYFYYFKYQTF